MIKKLIRIASFVLCLTSCVLFVASCEANDPPPDNGNGNGEDKPKPKITLTLDDNSCTEIWLNVDVENIQLPDTFLLRRNGVAVNRYEITQSGMEVYLDSLPPSQSYTYTAIINDTVTSEITASTMDTTSHNFSYEVFEFGEHRNSVLRDVAIIDENDIWAVGAIYLKDSTGANDSKVYNAVHWNGSEWEFSKVTYVPFNTVHAFSSNDIWAFTSAPYHYDGVSWTPHNISGLFNGYAYGAWGTSSNDLYMVGGNGSIAHYNGTTWSKVESGTSITLLDVFGTTSNDVYVGGVKTFESGIVLKGNSSGFSVYKESGYVSESELFNTLYAELGAVWVDEKGTLYTAGSYLYWQRRGQWNFVETLPENYYQANVGAPARGYITRISGNGSNDYTISGGRNTLQHFNGIDWQQIGMDYRPSNPIIWRGLEQKGDLVIAVGEVNSKAVIIKLQR